MELLQTVSNVSYNITPIITALLALMGTIVTSILIPWIKSKTTAQQQEDFNSWVRIFVLAAEQIFNGSGKGKEKFEYVVERLEAMGFKIDEDALKAMIEAAVKQMNDGLL